jgi:hypothetical protein
MGVHRQTDKDQSQDTSETHKKKNQLHEQAVGVPNEGGGDRPSFELEGPVDRDRVEEDADYHGDLEQYNNLGGVVTLGESVDLLADSIVLDVGLDVVKVVCQVLGKDDNSRHFHGRDHDKDRIDHQDSFSKVAAKAKTLRVVPGGVFAAWDLVIDFESLNKLVFGVF